MLAHFDGLKDLTETQAYQDDLHLFAVITALRRETLHKLRRKGEQSGSEQHPSRSGQISQRGNVFAGHVGVQRVIVCLIVVSMPKGFGTLKALEFLVVASMEPAQFCHLRPSP